MWRENPAWWKSRWCSVSVRSGRQRRKTAEGKQGEGKVRGGKLLSESEVWVTARLTQNPSSWLVGGSLLIYASGATQLQSNAERTRRGGWNMLVFCVFAAVASGDWWVSLRHINRDSKRIKSPLFSLAKAGNERRRRERWGSLNIWKYQNSGTQMANQFSQSISDFIN